MTVEGTILGIDTSGETYALALCQGQRVLAECSGGQPRQHLVQLFPALQLLCRQAGLWLDQLQGVAVTAGPGSFTGVRTGLLIAKTLGQALQLPVFPVDTLLALAANAVDGSSVVAALDARKGEVIWGAFEVEKGRARALENNRLGPPEEFLGALPENATLLGSACQTYGHLLQGRRVLPADFWRVRAAAVARHAEAPRDWSQLRPDYVRPADVQVHGT